MNVLQVVTLISPDGAYGGPTRVAFNQVRTLRADGHVAEVTAACRGYDPVPSRLDGVPVTLCRAWRVLPRSGHAAIAAPRMLWRMLRRRSRFDVVHVHLARDLTTLPAALLAIALRKRLVVQTHGMIVESTSALAPILDALITRPVLRRADAVLYLSEQERRGLLHVESELALTHLPNGVPAWTPDPQSPGESGGVEVLYLARLQKRKQPLLFVAAAAELLAEGLDATFTVVGPDGGLAAEVTSAIADVADRADRIRYEGALSPSATIERMSRAAVYVLPSIDEPFPMSVLEAMSVGLPVVVTDTCGLADVVDANGCGLVVSSGSRESLVEAVRQLLLDPERRTEMGVAARRTAEAQYGMAAIGRRLSSIYRGESVTVDA